MRGCPGSWGSHSLRRYIASEIRQDTLVLRRPSDVNAFLAVINRVQGVTFRILEVLIRESTALLARVLRRGRYRTWRKGI